MIIPPELSMEDAAVIYIDALRVMGALEARCVDQEPDSHPLPRGMLTCGEATLLIPAVVRLALMSFPDLADPDALEQAVRAAVARSAAGVAN